MAIEKDNGGQAVADLSLRDYFAAQAVSRLLEYMLKEYEDDEPFTKAASDAYMLADAMLKARTK